MTTRKKQPPMINAPWPIAAFALVVAGAHLIRIFLPEGMQDAMFIHGALIPERFWSSADAPSLNSLPPYANGLMAAAPLVLSGFLHSDWMHVIFNAVFLVALGKPLLDVFRSAWPGREPGASLCVLGVYLVAQVAGSLVYLAANYPAGAPAIGASGGVGGMIAAVLLLREGPDRWIFSRTFLAASSIFVVANAMFALVGPALLGSNIAWQSHVGGYIGGALAMRAMIGRMRIRA